MEIINRMSGSWFMLDVDNLIKFMADQRRGQKQGSEGWYTQHKFNETLADYCFEQESTEMIFRFCDNAAPIWVD